MDREIARKTWDSIGRSLKNKRVGSMSAVEICHNGIYLRYEGKERLEAGLRKSLSELFKLTRGTPMRSGKPQQDFGLLGNPKSASKVLKSTYVAPRWFRTQMIKVI